MTNEELKAQLDRIEAAVLATNGRVRALELWQARLKGSWTVVLVAAPMAGALVAHALGLG